MLTKVGCVSGCSLVHRTTKKNTANCWKATYYLCYSHGLVINEKSTSVYDGDYVGPSNIKTEYLKCVKTAGNSFKGNKIYESVYYQFVEPILYMSYLYYTKLSYPNCTCSLLILSIRMFEYRNKGNDNQEKEK